MACPTPTPLPELTPEPTPTAASLAPLPEELAAYAPYGLTANGDGTLTYLGSTVRFPHRRGGGRGAALGHGRGGRLRRARRKRRPHGLRAANWDEFAQETAAYGEAAPATYQRPLDRVAGNWGVDRTTLAAYAPLWRELGGGYARLPRRAHPLYLR